MVGGIAELPLHEGRVPRWIASIMYRMARAILEIAVDELGPEGVVESFADPFWFQAFNNIIGMDWDSSGSTTVTTGIVKAITWRHNLGFIVLGGKGERSRRVPREAGYAVKALRLSEDHIYAIEEASRLTAKIDSAMLQDGYTLYHHAVFITENGRILVIQQGMNTAIRMARRYHIPYKRGVVEEPHQGIACNRVEALVIDLTSRLSRETRRTIIDILNDNTDDFLSDYARLYAQARGVRSILEYTSTPREGGSIRAIPSIYKPMIHPLKLREKVERIRRLQVSNIEDLLLVGNASPSLIRALTLISDLIYNTPPSKRDPVSHPITPEVYAYAIGGKDGVPYPINRRHAERVISTLEEFIARSRIEQKYRYRALRSLARIARTLHIG